MAAIISTIILLLSLWPKALILGRGNSSGPRRLTDPGLISAAGQGKDSGVVDDGQLRASGSFPNSPQLPRAPHWLWCVLVWDSALCCDERRKRGGSLKGHGQGWAVSPGSPQISALVSQQA